MSEMYPDITMEHSWADEDIGINCGRYSYRGGERIEEYFPESKKEATEFACEIWGHEPAELDMYLNAEGTKYIHVELEEYQRIELFGKTALFTNDRLMEKDIPKGLYCYYLRHSDDGNRFCSIGPKVAVNHGGSVIIDEPLDFGKDGYIAFSEDTEPDFLGEDMTFGEYMRKEFRQSLDRGMHM